MKALTIQMKQIDDVKSFVRLNEQQPFDVDVSLGRYEVDGKSIMGVFQLDLANPVTVKLHTDDENEIAQYETALGKIFSPEAIRS